MKFHFITASLACPQRLYTWVRRPVPARRRATPLLVHIQAAHTASRRTYRAPRIHHELHAQGVPAGRTGLRASCVARGSSPVPSAAESFLHTLKTELVYQHCYRTREEARLARFEYIAAFYNRTQRHSSNWHRSPTNTKRTSLSMTVNRVSTFLGQLQSATS